MTTLLLVHGGLWEAGMDADRFWGQPGIVAGLQKRGFDVLAPDRPHQAPDWAAEASHLASALPGQAEASYLASALPGRPRLPSRKVRTPRPSGALAHRSARTRLVAAIKPGLPRNATTGTPVSWA
jgi:hypothetical protein